MQEKNLLYKRSEKQYTVHAYKRHSRQWTRSQQQVKLFEPQYVEIMEWLPSDIFPVDKRHNTEAISISNITKITSKKAPQQTKTRKTYIGKLLL